MFGALLSFLGSGVFGSIIGLIGNVITQKQVRKTKKMEMQHEINMARAQVELLNAKTDASIKIAKAKIEGAVELEESKAYTTNIVLANQKSFSDRWLDKMLAATGWVKWFAYPFAGIIMAAFAFLDFVKGLIRPVLTIAFTVGFGWIAYYSYTILQTKGINTLSTNQAVLYFTLVVDTCIMLTNTCVTWWYADRRNAKNLAKMTEKRLSPGKTELIFK